MNIFQEFNKMLDCMNDVKMRKFLSFLKLASGILSSVPDGNTNAFREE